MTPDQIKAIREAFDKGVEDIKNLVGKQAEEIKAQGETSKDTASKLEKAQSDLVKVGEDLKAAQERMDELEKRNGRLGAGVGNAEFRSVGQQFTDSAEFKAMIEKGDLRSNPMKLKSLFPSERRAVGSFDASGNYIGPRNRLAEIIAPGRRTRHLRELMTVRPTAEGAIEYVQESGYAPIETLLAADAALNAASLVVTNAQGFVTGQKARVFGQATVYTIGAINLNTNTIAISPNLTAAALTGVAVTSDVFNATPEGKKKPRAGLTFELKTATARVLAHGLPIPRQVVNDIGAMQAYADDRLTMGLLDIEDFQILYGDGTSQMLDGILTNTKRQTYARAGETKLEAVRKAMTKAVIAEYMPTGVILNHADWEEIQLTKDTTGAYIWINVNGQEDSVWAVPVLPTNAIPVGKFVVGAFDTASFLWDREEANIRVADQHEDFFEKNMLFMLAEERLAHTIFRPEAFVEGTF